MPTIKIKLVFISFVFATTVCFSQDNICDKNVFESFKAQADSIHLYMQKAIRAKPGKRKYWERKFFCAFPDSYASMDSIFGFNKVAGPLYYSDIPESFSLFGNMSTHINFFSHLTSIPSDTYYKKYIEICIGGYWQADNIQVSFGFGLHLLNNTKIACAALDKKTDSEIKSVFRFIFDGPHPNNETNKDFFNLLHPLIKNENQRLAQLLNDAFNKLMNEDHRH